MEVVRAAQEAKVADEQLVADRSAPPVQEFADASLRSRRVTGMESDCTADASDAVCTVDAASRSRRDQHSESALRPDAFHMRASPLTDFVDRKTMFVFCMLFSVTSVVLFLYSSLT